MAKENKPNSNESSKSKTTVAEKNKTPKNKKSENPKKEENRTEENKPENNTEEKPTDTQKEQEKKKPKENKPYAPKINSIIPEKSESQPEVQEDKPAPETEVFNLPDIDESEINKHAEIIGNGQNNARSIPKTIMSWCLIILGIMVILVSIILNLRIPHGANFKYHQKHHTKYKKNKNKYRLKYK